MPDLGCDIVLEMSGWYVQWINGSRRRHGPLTSYDAARSFALALGFRQWSIWEHEQHSRDIVLRSSAQCSWNRRFRP